MKKVREGYKMTELGEIPEEWDVKTLSEITRLIKDGTHNPPERTEEGIPLLSAENIFNNKINFGINEKNISQKSFEAIHKGYSIEKNDVLLTCVGSIGRTAVVKDEPLFTIQRSVAVFKLCEGVDSYYFNYSLKSEYVKKQLKVRANTTAQAGIYLGELAKINTIIPKLSEQQKISLILTSVDEQIEITDNLIEKTKQLKKGLMQRLLTKGIGHSRFKNTEIGRIPEGWELIELSECGEVFGGNAFKSNYFSSDFNSNTYQVIRMGNVQQGKLELERNPVYLDKSYMGKKEEKYVLKNSDILISLTGTINKTDYGNISWVSQDDMYLLNQRVACIRNRNNNFFNRFYFYFFQDTIFRNQFFQLGVGGTGNQSNVSISDLNKILLYKPSIDEQKKIAQILSSVDEKIEQYESKKEKLQELKKGLMQKLLTGKIRVKI